MGPVASFVAVDADVALVNVVVVVVVAAQDAGPPPDPALDSTHTRMITSGVGRVSWRRRCFRNRAERRSAATQASPTGAG